MRVLSVLAVLTLTGCMCRPGVIDCTTNRAYPGFCKPLCGGPLDPFMWAAGDCSTCCCCSYRCGYTPYGGRTICGDDMVYTPSCVSPPLRWAPPAVPAPPTGHVVHLPGPAPPRKPPVPPAAAPVPPSPPESIPETPPAAPPAEPSPLPGDEPEVEEPFELPGPLTEPEARSGPRILHDARNEHPDRTRL